MTTRAQVSPRRTLRVGTFNVRNSAAVDGEWAWSNRRATLIDLVRANAPDLIGFQEVLPDQQQHLAEDLAEYDSVATHRDDGVGYGEAASVFFKRDRFDKLDAGTFWLSPDSDRPGPAAWDAACPRICTWAVLHDKSAGRNVAVFNTHFDHEGDLARLESAALVVRHLAALEETAILMGDFNATEDSPVYVAVFDAARAAGRPLTDAHRAVHPMRTANEASFHGFTAERLDAPQSATAGLRIDWILHDDGLRAIDSRIGPATDAAGRFASDHAPVWAELHYTNERTVR